MVILSNNEASVSIADIKDGEIISSLEEHFSLDDTNSFTTDLISFINQKQNEVTKSYVITILNSLGQGMIPTCDAGKFHEYNVDMKNIYNVCVDKKFTNYVSKIDIKWIQKIFAPTGVDFIFSPFIMLNKMMEEEEINSDVKLHILYINYGVTLLIKKNTECLFGSYFNISQEEDPLYTQYDSSCEEDEDEDAFDIDDEFELEDEFEIEDEEDNDYETSDELSMIEEDKRFIKYLNISLKEFYSTKIYDSSFIDSVIIYSDTGMEQSLLEYVENELFLDTTVKKINYIDCLFSLSQDEVLS